MAVLPSCGCLQGMAEVLAAYSQQGLQPAHCYGWCVCHEAGHNCSIPLHASKSHSITLLQVDGSCTARRRAFAKLLEQQHLVTDLHHTAVTHQTIGW
jgi:hypothetical protein